MDRPDLSISVHRTGGEAVVTLVGEIDMSTVQRLAKVVDEMLVTEVPVSGALAPCLGVDIVR